MISKNKVIILLLVLIIPFDLINYYFLSSRKDLLNIILSLLLPSLIILPIVFIMLLKKKCQMISRNKVIILLLVLIVPFGLINCYFYRGTLKNNNKVYAMRWGEIIADPRYVNAAPEEKKYIQEDWYKNKIQTDSNYKIEQDTIIKKDIFGEEPAPLGILQTYAFPFFMPSVFILSLVLFILMFKDIYCGIMGKVIQFIVERKQLIIIWTTGLLISLLCLFPPQLHKSYYRYSGQTQWIEHNFIFTDGKGQVLLTRLIAEIIPILIIGGLLIYTFRDKKNKEK